LEAYFNDDALAKERKEIAIGSKNRTRVGRLSSGHAYHSATTPCWRGAETYAIRTKPESFKGGNESLHRTFAAVLTKDPTAPELHRGEPWLERALHTQPKQHAAV